jgi:hypothetical protein
MYLVNAHAPLNAAAEGISLVVGEIISGVRSQ